MPTRTPSLLCFFFFQAEDGIRDYKVTGVQTCALPIFPRPARLVPQVRDEQSRGDEQHGLSPEQADARPAVEEERRLVQLLRRRVRVAPVGAEDAVEIGRAHV